MRKRGQPADARYAGEEGLSRMLMTPEPSSQAAAATGSRLPVGAELKLDPEVASRVIVASEEVLRAARLQAREPNALGSSPNTRDSQSTIGMHGPW